jgi:hypothetical protein
MKKTACWPRKALQPVLEIGTDDLMRDRRVRPVCVPNKKKEDSSYINIGFATSCQASPVIGTSTNNDGHDAFARDAASSTKDPVYLLHTMNHFQRLLPVKQ